MVTVALPGTGVFRQARLSGSVRRPGGTQASGTGHGSGERPSRSRGTSRRPVVKTLRIAAAVAFCVRWLSSRAAPRYPVTPPAAGAEAKATDAVPGGTRPASGPDGAASIAPRDPLVILSTEDIRDGASRHAKVVGIARQPGRCSVYGRSGAWVRIGKDVPLGWVGASRLGT